MQGNEVVYLTMLAPPIHLHMEGVGFIKIITLYNVAHIINN